MHTCDTNESIDAMLTEWRAGARRMRRAIAAGFLIGPRLVGVAARFGEMDSAAHPSVLALSQLQSSQDS